MKTERTTLRARFAPATRYEVVPQPVVPFRGTRESELEQFKHRLLRDALHASRNVELYTPLRRAANEAAALAWTTPFPMLFFPALFEEKARTAEAQTDRQRKVRARSRRILEIVV